MFLNEPDRVFIVWWKRKDFTLQKLFLPVLQISTSDLLGQPDLIAGEYSLMEWHDNY